ncbi:putative AAA+ superfamily ATPase [Rhizobium aethiopicum]|uniref:Putative AAA+ superfamily ATPase n=1 Tax=Rhizobium aethiopicum TaxID=1138170 RepID=A0A7W6MJE7_9HYPH|nr:putative AAA+ superfamily ATPase [Rhizobium aethiopicum]MBB4579264.1 putative AAA+ superfamily ATPase [Rhizobium aethiopicum]
MLDSSNFRRLERQTHEVEVVLERNHGMVVGIEVNASATVRATDFGGLKTLADACGQKFAFGVVLYDGADIAPFGDRLTAVPLSCLWR